jgi:hypothetical protein
MRHIDCRPGSKPFGLVGMTTIDKRSIAARLRSLMTAPVEQVARWLHVSEAALRAAVQSLGPRPTIEVVVAASIYYGVDPAWILADDYDPDALRAAAEGDVNATTAAVVKILRTVELDAGHDEPRLMTSARRRDQAVTEFSRLARDRVTADQREREPLREGTKESSDLSRESRPREAQ